MVSTVAESGPTGHMACGIWFDAFGTSGSVGRTCIVVSLDSVCEGAEKRPRYLDLHWHHLNDVTPSNNLFSMIRSNWIGFPKHRALPESILPANFPRGAHLH